MVIREIVLEAWCFVVVKTKQRQLAEMFNDRGIPSAYLSGDHNFDKREN